MARIYDIRQKEVINVRDGARFGYAADLDIDVTRGKIVAVIVAGPGRMFGIFGSEQEFIIPWDCIVQMGEDIILVDVNTEKVLVDCE